MRNKRVLVCDDDKDILEMLEIALEINGFEVISEQDSTRIFHIIDSSSPDAVLLDLWMPMLSGDEIVKRLREDPSRNKIPVVIISASQDGKSVALKAGANQYLEKPFDIDKLVMCLNEVLLSN
jgi:DNA-binding response OmpR family regulator